MQNSRTKSIVFMKSQLVNSVTILILLTFVQCHNGQLSEGSIPASGKFSFSDYSNFLVLILDHASKKPRLIVTGAKAGTSQINPATIHFQRQPQP